MVRSWLRPCDDAGGRLGVAIGSTALQSLAAKSLKSPQALKSPQVLKSPKALKLLKSRETLTVGRLADRVIAIANAGTVRRR